MFDCVCIFQVFHVKLTKYIECHISQDFIWKYQQIFSASILYTNAHLHFIFKNIIMSHLQPLWLLLRSYHTNKLCKCEFCVPVLSSILVFNKFLIINAPLLSTLGYIASPVLRKQAYLLYLPENQHLLFKDYIFEALHPILLLSSDIFLSKSVFISNVFFSKSVCLLQMFSF